jgi:RsiW-degrading membrane proteinase PrsW (M82 family)
MESTVSQQMKIGLHRPSVGEMTFFMIQGILISTFSTVFFESVALTGLVNYMSRDNAMLLILVVLAPLIEEFTKVFPLFYRHAETERSLFTLGFLTGLGFSLPEFVLYVLNGAPITLRLLGITFHAASTSISAYGIAKRNFPIYFTIAVGLHASNNLFAQNEQIWWVGGIASIFIAYLLSWRFYSRTRNMFFETSSDIDIPTITTSNPE